MSSLVKANRKSTLSFAVLLLTTLTWYYRSKKSNRQRSINIPVLKGLPIFGVVPGMVANVETIFDYTTSLYEKLDTLTFHINDLFFGNFVFTIDPRNLEYVLKDNFENYIKGKGFDYAVHDLLGKGIFNIDGEEWKIQRKTASGIFHVKNFRDHFTSVFLAEIEILSSHALNKAVKTGESIDLHNLFLRFTMDSFTEIGFGIKLNSLLKNVEFAESFDILQKFVFKKTIIPFYTVAAKIKYYASFSFLKNKSYQQHLDIVNNFAYDAIKKHKKLLEDESVERDDLLTRFMSAKSYEAKPLTDIELRDVLLNFLLAGRDTTAQTLSWAFHMMMEHPDIQDKVYQEAITIVTDENENDPIKLYEAVQEKAIYSHALFNEVLRLYPAVPGNQKEALNDDILPDGTFVRKGDVLSWQSYAQGRMEKIWGSDAKQFKPERWISEEGKLRRVPACQWTAFHVGPRLCLGQNLATLEALITILILTKRYKFHHVPGHEVKVLNAITLSMKYGLKVTVEKR